MFARKVFEVVVESALTHNNIVVGVDSVDAIIDFYCEDSVAALYRSGTGLQCLKERIKTSGDGKTLIVEDKSFDNFIDKSSGTHPLYQKISECQTLDEVSLYTGIPKSILTNDAVVNETDLSQCATLAQIREDVIAVLERFDIEYHHIVNEEQQYRNIIREFIEHELQ
jgi:hypothetical protein